MLNDTASTTTGGRTLRMVLQDMRHPGYPPYVHWFADEIENALASAAQPVPAAEVGGPLNELEELNLLNEPAFPIRGGLHEHQFVGASLRDYFAAKAMQGFVSSYPNGDVNCDFEYLADDAYDMADAMLKARAKGGVE